MTIGTLITGLLGLVALLVGVGALGGVGSVELAIWLALVATWIFWWLMRRRARRTSP